MSVDTGKLSKLRWRCRRGMRELDQEMQDPELFQLISGKAREARYQTILDKMSFTLAGRT